MNEAERLAYLDAMGVQSYTPRVILPGALRSEQCEASELFELSKPEAVAVSASDAFKQLQASLADVKTRNPVAIQSPTTPTVNTVPSLSVRATQMSVRFHWVIFQPTQAVLLLIPSAHTDQKCMELLKKILSAIGIVAPLTALENFVWPPVLAVSSDRAVTMNSLNDAKETLSALLEGYQLKQKKSPEHLKQVLVFDENLGKTLFEGVDIPGLQLRILPSLQLMVTSSPEKVKELKGVAWQRLVDLPLLLKKDD